MKITYLSIFMILLVPLSGIPLISGSGTVKFASARYANTQTQVNANECNTGTNCAINNPQTQGDGSASSPINSQISRFNEEQEEGPTTPDSPAILIGHVRVTTEVRCPQGFVCPVASDFVMQASARGPSGNIIIIDPRLFNGEVDGRDVRFVFATSPVLYLISQTVPPTPQGLTLTTTDSPECVGDLQNGVTRNCLFINEYRVSTHSP
jgi:hypothetical protein